MMGRARNRRRTGVRERRFRLPQVNWRALLLTGSSVGAVALAAGAVAWALDQPVREVAVQGRFQRVSAVDVERAVKARVRGAGLLSLDLEDVARAIHALPWVDAVSVERAWPRGLTVRVVEQVAAARWGEHGLLNVRGELFALDEQHVPSELARLSGPEGTQASIAQRYLAEQGRLTQAGLRLTALRLDARGAWEFDLANGVTVRLGRRQVDERFDRFVATAARLVGQRGEDIAYVDMRYTNGFAIGWRSSARALTHAVIHDLARDGAHDA